METTVGIAAALRSTMHTEERGACDAAWSRAVPMYSEPSTWMVDARRLRMIVGHIEMARVNAGRNR